MIRLNLERYIFNNYDFKYIGYIALIYIYINL